MVRRGYWRKRHWGLAVLAAVVVLVVSCSSCVSVSKIRRLFPPALPDGAFVVKKSEYYHQMWREVEGCSGLTYPFDKVTLYAVPSTLLGFLYKGTALAGYGDRENGFILMGVPWLTDDALVRHEMLHVIASPEGHNALYYGVFSKDTLRVAGKCSHLIVCRTCSQNESIPVSER